jgi:hypothetical protein
MRFLLPDNNSGWNLCGEINARGEITPSGGQWSEVQLFQALQRPVSMISPGTKQAGHTVPSSGIIFSGQWSLRM